MLDIGNGSAILTMMVKHKIMKAKTKNKPVNRTEIWKSLDKQTILKIAEISGGDGHSIFKPEAYQAAGMPLPLLASFTQTFESDGTPKGTISDNDGKIVAAMTGVYGLNVVESIVSAFNLTTGCFMGRGFRARAAFDAIKTYCESV